MLNVPEFQKAAKDFRAGKLDIQQFTRLLYAVGDASTSQPTKADARVGTNESLPRSGQTSQADSANAANGPRLNLDLARVTRCGYSEVIYAPGKSLEDLNLAAQRLLSERQSVLITRLEAPDASALLERFPTARHNAQARTFSIASGNDATAARANVGTVAVLTAGTGDIPVAEEACETLRWMGFIPTSIYDIGVAGPQRLLNQVPFLQTCDVIVVVAGMEGALPSVVGGHVACPVIAVPTSLGYGAHFQGLVPLLGMINSCAANVIAVNIDSGFKGGFVAGLILSKLRASV
ncbi:MAG: nickel pincer cofactor biosynthesis protein LarB [Pirellulaceae bacterium]|nr:nickel pincer cofactor biosynthesis protein LarB [Pirellulaceae bacterium]